MKKSLIYFAGAAVLLASACSEEQFNTEGQGKIALRTSVNSDVEVVSRASEQELADNCMIWISSEKGLVRRYNNLSEVPASIDLVTGRYIAEAWTGDSVSASWDKRWFKGREEFNVEAGKTTQVDLTCKIANVVASVKFAEGLEDYLSDITMTVGHDRGSLIFEGRDERKGYFMMPSTDTGLTYELKGTQADGSEFYFTDRIENVKPATEYILNVTYRVQDTQVGGAVLTVVVDENEITINNTIEVIGAPSIEGHGFDIKQPVTGEQGTIGRRTLYIASATALSEVVLRSDEFNKIPVIAGNDFELLGMTQDGIDAINAAGITFKHTFDAENNTSLLQLNFEETFTNALENGEYAIEIEATDDKGHTTNAVLSILISDAPVVTMPVNTSKVGTTFATLYASVAKEGLESAGFNYRKKGDADWTYVEGTINGAEVTVDLTGLDYWTSYEYAAVAGDFVSGIIESFTTLDGEQLPNSSFEIWGQEGKAIIFDTDYTNSFWDSGNHGSATMNKNVTTQNTNKAFIADGSYSVMLKSQFVGLGFIGKFAAGNIFAGKYLDTIGTNGVLGWGQGFTGTPKSVTFYARYIPGTVVSGSNKGSGDKMPVGATDQGIVYVALVDETLDTRDEKYNSHPCVVNTDSQQFFEKDGANVIAYGEVVFDKETEGTGLVKVTIPLEYYREGVTPSNIIFVGSASRYGDYFQGGEGSTLYLDAIHMDY